MHPLQSNQYWSNALKSEGYRSETLMKWVQEYQNRNTYDKFIDQIKIVGWNPFDKYLLHFFWPFIAFTYAIRKFDIFHHHFYGGFLCETWLMRFEAQLLRAFGCKTVITAVGGGDFYRYDSIINISLLTGHLMCYPEKVFEDESKQKKIKYWTKHADFIMVGFQIDKLGRWDMMPFNMVCIETKKMEPKVSYSPANGKDGAVRIIHAPNHRGAKGTEFIQKAVIDLQNEGLKIEFKLVEKMQNSELIKLLRESDILVDQLIFAYGLNAIEGMSLGLPVVANLENEEYTRAFRRFSYLNECPIASATPENIKGILKILIENPELREELGIANRKYTEKYHSEETTRFIYQKIYDKIWHQNSSEDLMQIFHPLNPSSYNNSSEIINHPLFENKIKASN
jgi:glycosyltransferase involved in cell wall biosynthesis